MLTEPVQRLRAVYAVDGPLRYLSVLDMGRLWERLLRRARLPLAFTQGFNPHPRLAFATPLPVGYSSSMEIVDLYLGASVPAEEAKDAMVANAPDGLVIESVSEVNLHGPALQGIMRSADYDVSIWSEATAERAQQALAELLQRPTLPYTREREGRQSTHDLRPLLLNATYLGHDGVHHLHMTMVCSPQGVGRPEELVAALDLPVSHWAICRTALRWQSGEEES